MTLTAFNCRLGRGQGRVQPVGHPPASGDYVFVIGDDTPGRRYNLAPGDYGEATTQVDLTDLDLVRVQLHLRVPDDVPAGMAWVTSIIVGSAKIASATCAPGRARTLSDLAANVSKLSGVHQVGVRLDLVIT